MAVPVTRRYRNQAVSNADLAQVVSASAIIVANYANAVDVQIDPGVPGTTDTLDEFMLGIGYVFDAAAPATPVGGNYVKSVFVEQAADVTAGVAFADLLTIAITTGASKLNIAFSAGIGLSFTVLGVLSTVSFRILLDAVPLRGTSASASLTGLQGTAALQLQTPVTAGPHTVTLQWKVVGVAAAADIRPVAAPDFEHASLLVEELAA